MTVSPIDIADGRLFVGLFLLIYYTLIALTLGVGCAGKKKKADGDKPQQEPSAAGTKTPMKSDHPAQPPSSKQAADQKAPTNAAAADQDSLLSPNAGKRPAVPRAANATGDKQVPSALPQDGDDVSNRKELQRSLFCTVRADNNAMTQEAFDRNKDPGHMQDARKETLDQQAAMQAAKIEKIKGKKEKKNVQKQPPSFPNSNRTNV